MHKDKPKSSAPTGAEATTGAGATTGATVAPGATPSAAEATTTAAAPATTTTAAPATTATTGAPGATTATTAAAPSAIIPPTSVISRYIGAIRRLKSFLHRYSPHNLIGQAKYDLSQLKRLNKWSYYHDPNFKPEPMKSSRLVNWVRHTMSNTRNAIKNLNRLNSLLMNQPVRKQIVKTAKLLSGITKDVLPDAAKELEAAKTQAVNEISTAAAQAGVAVLQSVPGIQAPLSILSAADKISAAGEKIGDSLYKIANIADNTVITIDDKIDDKLKKMVPDLPEFPEIPDPDPDPTRVQRVQGGNRRRRSNRRTKKKGKYLKRNINMISSRRRRRR